jgi:hypothetical protein
MKKRHTLRSGFENWVDPADPALADFVDELRRDRRPQRGIRALLASVFGGGHDS